MCGSSWLGSGTRTCVVFNLGDSRLLRDGEWLRGVFSLGGARLLRYGEVAAGVFNLGNRGCSGKESGCGGEYLVWGVRG